MKSRPLIPVFIVAAFLAAPPISAQDCRQVVFSEEPSWAIHADWSAASGGDLLIADRRSAEILAFKRDGRYVRSALANEVENHKALSRKPIAIKQWGGAQVLQLTGNRLVRYRGAPGPSDALDLDNTDVNVGSRKASLVTIHEWVPAGSDLVLLGDLYLDDSSLAERDRRISGIVRLKLSDSFEIVEANLLGDHWLFDSPTWRRHRVILHMLTASESGMAYFLRLDDTPRIYFNRPGSTELKPLGDLVPRQLGASSPPEIPDVSLRQVTLIMAEVEDSTLVSGIHWWNGHLYAVHREPAEDGATQWSLIKIDPENGKILGRSRLPTKANHLLVAPGDTWALIEKGRYWSYGDQDIPSAYLIDGEIVEDFQPALCESSIVGSGI